MPPEPNHPSPDPARREHVAISHGHVVTCRAFSSLEDTDACVVLQRAVWGEDFDLVPASLIQAVLHIGGLAIGAFDDTGAMLGFVFSLPGTWHGELVHWSHMLAVSESARNLGIGRTLKELQRAELAHRGIGRMLWTFDPLQARNAHLNLNRLGVHVVDYVENMYGITRSPLHHGLATDRLIVSCATDIAVDETHLEHHDGHANGGRPILSAFPRPGDPTRAASSRPLAMLLEIPDDFQQTVNDSPQVAAVWRVATRRHFMDAIHSGYRVTGLVRDRVSARAFYTLQLIPSSSSGAPLEHPAAFNAALPLPPAPVATNHPPHTRSDV